MLRKNTKSLALSLFCLLALGSCYSPGHMPDPVVVEPVPTKCSEVVEFHDAKAVELPLLKHYIDAACEITEQTSLIVKVSDIRVIFAGIDAVITICSRELGTSALACTISLPSEHQHLMIIPWGAPGVIKHEMLHVIMHENGLPGAKHHEIMKQMGEYWVGGDK